MNTYLVGVTATVLICAILTSVLPEGKTAVVIAAIIKLLCLLVIIFPIFQTLQSIKSGEKKELFEYFFIESGIYGDENFINYHSGVQIAFAEMRIQEEIKEKFSFENKVSLAWKYEENKAENGYTIQNVRIVKINVDITKPFQEQEVKSLREYLEKNYASEVQIE